jgi:4,5-DOPA dioxygenase extradiol
MSSDSSTSDVAKSEPVTEAPWTGPRVPAVFVAHGSPLLLDDAKWVAELRAWAEAIPRPKAILAISAHWVEAPIATSTTLPVKLVYDFTGFPQKYYDVKYPAPGAHRLRERVLELLEPTGGAAEGGRGLDHGAYVPLAAMYPAADVPVLQLSLPTLEMPPLVELGRTLAPLRDEGYLVMGSGFLTHNLRDMSFRAGTPPPKWATTFDASPRRGARSPRSSTSCRSAWCSARRSERTSR